MNRVRIIGRRPSEERCAICHGALREQASTCPQCRVDVHADCRAELGRCPTLGCAASTATAAPATDVHAPASGWHRLGPFAHLTLSGALSTAGLLVALAFVLWPLLSWSSFHLFMTTSRQHGHLVHDSSLATLVKLAFTYGFVGLGGWSALAWLWRIPREWREVSRLLRENHPEPAFLSVTTTGSGKLQKSFAYLERRDPRHPETLTGTLSFEVTGLLPPRWLLRVMPRTRVYFYGAFGHGPYLIELPDGRIALVDPD